MLKKATKPASWLRFLISFLVLYLGLTSSLAQIPQPTKTITIHSKKFAFSPSTITLTKNQPVKLVLVTDDVRHGLSVRDIGLRIVAAPGQPAETVITPTTVGDFTGKCSNFCGSGHHDMVFTVHVVE